MRQPFPAGLQGARDTEIDQLDVCQLRGIGMQEDICGLDVPMHDVLAMGIVERRRNMLQERQRLADVEPAPVRKQAGEVSAGEHLHGEERLRRIGGTDRKDGGDAGMLQVRHHPCLLKKALPHVAVVRQVRRQDFERLEALQSHVPHQVDRGHAALSQLAIHTVVADR